MTFNSNAIVFLLLITNCIPLFGSSRKHQLTVSLSQSRAESGQTVSVTIRAEQNGESSTELVQAVLLKPSIGTESLSLHPRGDQPGIYSAVVVLAKDASQGLYVIHAWTGDRENPSAVGIASFLVDRIVGDFLIASALDGTDPADDLKHYLDDFHQISGNFLIAHNLLTQDKAYFRCHVCRLSHDPPAQSDIVELLLKEADERGYAVLLSVSWDMTQNAPYDQRMTETMAIMDDLFRQYAKHPSFAGFYSFQEGSGTHYVPYMREFSRHAKSLDPGLLVACAPYVDDPLLAGYLSTLKDLDIIIWQSGVMGSYRPDNRKEYPVRRVRDFSSLVTGAKRLQEKIALTHVELFGYLEERVAPDIPTTNYNNIYQQILSAATVSDSDGIILFSFQYHIYDVLKQYTAALQSRKAVVNGLAAFELISSRDSNALALYFPYSDWVIERWSNSFLPALDAFRVLGIPVDVLPYAPPLDESILPYYPIHMNRNVLSRLLKERTVLVLPDISGFQQTDSDLMKAFVEQSGAVIAFGPEIPMGRSYERRELFGGEQLDEKVHTSIVVRKAFGDRVKVGSRFALENTKCPSWSAGRGRVIAEFEDGSAAILVNSHDKGTVVTIVPDAWTATQRFPELIRDAIDYALANRGVQRAVDILGTNERMDVATEKMPDGFAVAVINHNPSEKEVTILSLKPLRNSRADWVDLATHEMLSSSEAQSLKIHVPGGGFRAIEFRRMFQ